MKRNVLRALLVLLLLPFYSTVIAQDYSDLDWLKKKPKKIVEKKVKKTDSIVKSNPKPQVLEPKIPRDSEIFYNIRFLANDVFVKNFVAKIYNNKGNWSTDRIALNNGVEMDYDGTTQNFYPFTICIPVSKLPNNLSLNLSYGIKDPNFIPNDGERVILLGTAECIIIFKNGEKENSKVKDIYLLDMDARTLKTETGINHLNTNLKLKIDDEGDLIVNPKSTIR